MPRLVSLVFPKSGFAQAHLLSHPRKQGRFPVHERIQHSHGLDTKDGFCACPCFDLAHPEAFEPGGCGVDVAGGHEVGDEVARVLSRGEGDVFLYPQMRGQLEVGQVLLLRSRLGPDLTDIFPVGGLGIDDRKRLHHLLGAFRGRITSDGEDHDLIVRDPQCLTNCPDFRVAPVPRDERIRITAHRKNRNSVFIQAIADIDLLNPFGSYQDQWQGVEYFNIVGQISVNN